MSVLVTGGAGFVGSHVVRDLLLNSDERVVVYDAAPAGNALDLVLPERSPAIPLRVVRGAITETWRLHRLCEEESVDRIIHLASPLTQDVVADPFTGLRDICDGTAGIFEVARALAVKRVVWASSVAVFGGKDDYPDGPISNDAPHRPGSLYGSCKSLCERLGLDYREIHGVDNVGLRLSVVYGPARLRGYMTFPSEIIRSVALGIPVVIPTPEQALHWQYVEEVSAMFIAALAGDPRQGVAYNTCGDARTFGDAAEILSALSPDVPITLSRGEEADGAQRVLEGAPSEYDDSEFRKEFGYEMRFPLETGIERSLRAFSSIEERQKERHSKNA